MFFEGEETPFACGKKGFLPPQTPPSSPKPARYLRNLENQSSHYRNNIFIQQDDSDSRTADEIPRQPSPGSAGEAAAGNTACGAMIFGGK